MNFIINNIVEKLIKYGLKLNEKIFNERTKKIEGKENKVKKITDYFKKVGTKKSTVKRIKIDEENSTNIRE